MWPRLGGACVLLAVLLGGAAAAQEGNSCAVCHSQVAVDFAGSAHARQRMACVNCHGGNPLDFTSSAMAHGAGFRGAPARADIPAFCASCHADRLQMRQYGLPTDQYELYVGSQHGLALAKGDTSVAVCTDCHHNHAILPADDPRASVYPTNVPQTCGGCHANEKLMRQHDLPADTLEGYTKSVHGVALLQGRQLAAPSCASCHGSHGAAPPGVTEVGNVCGQCHQDVWAAVQDSPHARPTATGRMEECVSCHDHHLTEKATVALLPSVCSPCHRAGGTSWQQAEDIRQRIVAAEASLTQAEGAVQVAQAKGAETGELEAELKEARTALLQTARAQHTSEPSAVGEYARVVQDTAAQVMAHLDQLRAAWERRRHGLLAVWVLILCVIGSLYLKRRRVAARRQAADTHGEGP
jgi:predicted CXXCH cytochrome family protein